MASLTLHAISKSFGPVEVLKDIDLAIHNGEFVVFVGPSGCGKSTLLRVIAGLEQATGGIVEIDGRDVTALRAADRDLAMVFQSYALYPHMSVYKNIAFALENIGLAKAEIDARVAKAADMLRLTPLLARKPGQLSGGQRQRVAIGRAVVRDPKIFLFDEPLSNLDAELRVATRKELARLHADIGGTMIYVTHDQVEAMTLAHRIVVLNGGRIEQVGTPLDLYNEPANLFVAGFIGSPKMNFLALNAERKRMFGLTEGASLGIRPEHVVIERDNPQMNGRVELVEQLGGESYLYTQLATGEPFCLRVTSETPIRMGDTVSFRIMPERLHLFDDNGLRIPSFPASRAMP